MASKIFLIRWQLSNAAGCLARAERPHLSWNGTPNEGKDFRPYRVPDGWVYSESEEPEV